MLPKLFHLIQIPILNLEATNIYSIENILLQTPSPKFTILQQNTKVLKGITASNSDLDVQVILDTFQLET